MSAAVESLYVVKAGDSLSRIAQQFYGDANQYPRIAQANGLNPQAMLMIGTRLRIPASQQTAPEPLEEVQITAQRLPEFMLPASPGGSLVDPATGIETVTTTAYVWWKDWRWYAAGAGVALVLWYFSGRRK